MQFTPCIDQCTKDGTHCEGCGRSHQEIADTKKLVKSIVDFAQDHDYENIEFFTQYMGKKALKKLNKQSLTQ